MTNIPVWNLPTLADSVDPDALDAVINSTSAGTVAFPYAGQLVTVTSDGSVTVQRLDTEESTDIGGSER